MPFVRFDLCNGAVGEIADVYGCTHDLLLHRILKTEYDVKCRSITDLEHKISVLTNESVIMGRRNGGFILVHIGTNNADKEGTTATVE